MGDRPTFLTPEALSRWLPELRKQNKMYLFYHTPEWRHLRGQVLEANHYECEDCRRKSPAVITRATTVHHEMTVERHPELALSTFFIDDLGARRQQLWALCSDCHNARHERFVCGDDKNDLLTPERW